MNKAIKTNLNIIYKNPNDLKFYEKNNKDHPKKQIKLLNEIITKVGFRVPVIIDKNDVIVCGHARVISAKELKLAQIPCEFADDLSPEIIREYRLLDNKVTELAEDNMENIMFELQAIGNIELANIYNIDIDVINSLEIEDLDNGELEDIEEEIIVRKGDLFQLGAHRLLVGDTTIKEDVLKLMGGEKLDCIWTDPPYNVNYEGNAGKIENDNMGEKEFEEFLKKSFGNMEKSLKPGGPIYVAHSDTGGITFRKTFVESGFYLASCLIWNKNHMILGRSDYQWKHEPILYGWKQGKKHQWFGRRDKVSVIDFDKPRVSEIHPTMKPVGLIEIMLKNSAKKGQNVGDFFAGSGSTMIACEELGMKSFLMEYDEKYAQRIIRRYQKLTQKNDIKCLNRDLFL